MSRMNRRRFTWVATSGFASAALVACGGSNAVKDDITPTRIADVMGAPPTLAPNATPFSSSEQGGGEAAAPSSGPITVTGHDSLTFDPSSFTAAPGQVVHFVNGGQLQHDFIVDELNMTMEPIDGGAEHDLTIPEDAAPGDYTYYCSVPGHREAGMEGTLTIAEGGGEAAASGEEGGAAPASGPITVTGQDSLSFDPSSFQATPGQTIHFVNGGALQHDFIVDELGITMDPVDGGGEVDVTVPEDAAPGDYTYYCSLPGHREAGMEGTMTVVEAGAAGANEEDTPEEAATEEATPEEEAAAAGGGGAPAGPIEVHTLDALKFDPSEFEASPGQEIHVINDGVMQHDFVIDELNMATDLLNNGEEQTITVPEDAEVGQSYTYYCTVPGHQQAGMEGTMTIVAAGGGEAATEATAEATEEAAAAPAGPVDASQPVEVHTLDSLQFDPSEIAVAPGQTIHVVNDGALQHDFVVDEWGLATALLNNSESDDIVVPGDAQVGATYTYYCSVPGHAAAGMQGKLTVAEAAGGEAATTEAPEEATPSAEETAAAGATPEAELDDDVIRVAALDSMRFAPSQFSAAPGQQIYLLNRGVLIHDIVVDEWELDTGALGGGESSVFNIPDDVEVGAEVEFYCSVPGHRESGMVGTITIIEADVEQQAEIVTPVVEASPAGEAATPVAAEETAEAATPAAAEAAASSGGGGAIEVHTLDALKFDPEAITASPGQEIHVINEGVMQHDFIIDELDMATDMLNNGDEQTVTVPEDAEPGEYTYYCSVPGHRESGMEGTLTVE